MNSEIAAERTETTHDAFELEPGSFERLASENRKGLAQTSANGTSESIDDAWKRNVKTLTRTALKITRNADDASDAVSSAVGRCYEMQADGKAVRHWASMLQTLTIGCAIDIIRKRKATLSIDALDAEIILTAESAEYEALAALQVAQLQRECADNKPLKRLLKALAECETVSDAAARLRISRTQLYRDLARLRAKMGIVTVKAQRQADASVQQPLDRQQFATALLARGVCRYGSTDAFSVALVRSGPDRAAWEMFGPQWTWTEVLADALDEYRRGFNGAPLGCESDVFAELR